MLANIFYGLLLFAGGVLILRYRKIVHDWTGGWWWAEHYLWRGGTFTALSLIACIMMGLGVAMLFGKVNLRSQPLVPNETTNLNQPSESPSSLTP